MLPSRIRSPLAVRPLLVLLALIAPGPRIGTGQEPSPAPGGEAVLKARGLVRNGTTYVVPEEAEFLRKWSESRSSFESLVTEFQAIQGVRERRALIRNLEDQAGAARRDLAVINAKIDQTPIDPIYSTSKAKTKNANLRQQRTYAIDRVASIQNQIDMLRRRTPPPQKFEGRVKAFNDQRRRFLDETAALGPLLDRIIKRYGELSRDAEVKSALSARPKPSKGRYELGPSDALKRARREWFESRKVAS